MTTYDIQSLNLFENGEALTATPRYEVYLDAALGRRAQERPPELRRAESRPPSSFRARGVLPEIWVGSPLRRAFRHQREKR